MLQYFREHFSRSSSALPQGLFLGTLVAKCVFTKNKNTCITNFPSIGTTKANPVINKPQITAGKEKEYPSYTTCRYV